MAQSQSYKNDNYVLINVMFSVVFLLAGLLLGLILLTGEKNASEVFKITVSCLSCFLLSIVFIGYAILLKIRPNYDK